MNIAIKRIRSGKKEKVIILELTNFYLIALVFNQLLPSDASVRYSTPGSKSGFHLGCPTHLSAPEKSALELNEIAVPYVKVG